MINQEEYEIWITNLILTEFGNWLKKKNKLIHKLKQILGVITNLNDLHIIYDDEKYRNSILELYYKIDDKLGYTDCFNVIVYHKFNIKYLMSHDSDYNSIENLIRLEQIPLTG